MGENEIVFTPQTDDDLSEVDMATEKTMGQILSEVQVITDLIRKTPGAKTAEEMAEPAATQSKSKTAALKTTTAEAVKQTGGEQVQQLKGINKKMDIIAARLEDSPAGAVAQTQKEAAEKKAEEPAKAKAGGEVKQVETAKPAAPKTGETKKEAEGWEKFSAKTGKMQAS